MRAIGFDPLDVAEYTQPSPDQDAHVMTVLRTPTFNANRFRANLASVIAKIASGETEPLVIDIFDGAVAHNCHVGHAHFGAYEGAREDVEFVTDFFVAVDGVEYAYLFGLADKEVEVYQKMRRPALGMTRYFLSLIRWPRRKLQISSSPACRNDKSRHPWAATLLGELSGKCEDDLDDILRELICQSLQLLPLR